MNVLLVAVVAMLAGTTSVDAQAARTPAALAQALEGVWRQVDVRAADQTVTANQPGLRLFVDGHYSLIRVEGLQPRTQPDSLAWGPFTAQSGTYEAVDGQTITTRPLVAKNPSVMAGGNFTTSTVRLVGDTLWVTNIRTQAGPVTGGGAGRYVRVR